MASENVKIKILEKDNTKPGGAGIAPSDIVFIPGFSALSNAPKNVPTLCNDYLEFERLFGKTPKILTSKDVEAYQDYGFIAGSFDASYIYAKELLFQGMPVIYSNIVDDESSVYPNISTAEITGQYAPKFEGGSYSATDGSYQMTAIESFTGDVTLDFITEVKVTKAKNNVPVVTSFTLDAEVIKPLNNVAVKSIKISAPKDLSEEISCTVLSENQLDFTNKSKTDIHVNVGIRVELQLNIEHDADIDSNNVVAIRLIERPASCLDVFYGETPKHNIKEQLEMISDKSIYSVKYITSGGYPSVVGLESPLQKFSTEMLNCAGTRGDAVAIIDYQRNEDDVPFDTDPTSGSFYSKMQELFNGVANEEFGAMFYPWGEYSCSAALSNVNNLETADMYMPASFGYMMCVAKAIKTSPNWLAMAGVARGIVPKLNKICTPNGVLSNTLAEEMQPKFGVEGQKLSINCITNIRPYGLTLWGNRTMKSMNKEGAVALNFLNTRNMLSDIKKVLYSTAKSLMFEQNSDTLWLRFKSGITPLLNQLKTGQGISDYKIVKGTTKYDGSPLQKGEMAAVIKIYPLYAVEYFELAVEINDEDVIVS